MDARPRLHRRRDRYQGTRADDMVEWQDRQGSVAENTCHCHQWQQSGFANYRIRRRALLALAGRRQSGFSWTFTMRTTVSFVLCSQLEPTPTRTARCYLRSTTSSYERSITLSFDYVIIRLLPLRVHSRSVYIISHLIVSHVSPTEILVDLDTASCTSLIFPSRNTVLFIDISPPV